MTKTATHDERLIPNGISLPPPRAWMYRMRGGSQWTSTTAPPSEFRDKGEDEMWETVGLWSIEDFARATTASSVGTKPKAK